MKEQFKLESLLLEEKKKALREFIHGHAECVCKLVGWFYQSLPIAADALPRILQSRRHWLATKQIRKL